MRFGQENRQLTQAIRRVLRAGTQHVSYAPHALEEMDNDGFDQTEVLRALRKGVAYGPEHRANGEQRANVLYGGDLKIRVVIADLEQCDEDWDLLRHIRVITVMKDK